MAFDVHMVETGYCKLYSGKKESIREMNTSPRCYDPALLPSIICLGRLRIACRYIVNLWQLHQGFYSLALVRALDFYPGRPGSNPMIGGIFFQLCFIPLLWLSCRKMGLIRDRTLFGRKWLRIKKWGVLQLSTQTSIICLGRLRIACRYIFNLWQLRQGVDSLAQWLEHWIFIWTDRVRIPQVGNFFSCASFLCEKGK